jgi:predicted secreted protein
MGWFSGFVVYVILWWILFFMALPWGNRTAAELGQEVVPGHATSAPVKPRLWLKVGIVTLLAAALWGVADVVIRHNLVSFRTTPGAVWGN